MEDQIKPSTSLDYHRRIDKVMRHIGDHLDDALDLDQLATISCFSRVLPPAEWLTEVCLPLVTR